MTVSYFCPGLIKRISEKLLSPAKDTWKCSALQSADICKEFSEEDLSFSVFYPHPLPLLPHRMPMLWPTRCLSHGTPETILVPPAPTRGDSFGHRGRLRLGPSLTLACEGNSDRRGPTALTALLPNYRFPGETSGNPSCNCCLLSLRAVAVHAPIRRLPAGLTGHPVPHLHSQPCLSAPLDGAPQLLAPCFCGDKKAAPIARRCRGWAALRAAHHRSLRQKHSEPEIGGLCQNF